MEKELNRGSEAEVQLRRAYEALEKQIAERAAELARANRDLSEQITRCRDAEARFHAISESVPFGAWVYKLDGTAEQVSKLYLAFIGTTAENAKKMPWFSFLHPEDKGRVQIQWNEMVKQSQAWDCEFRVVGQDGEVRHLLSRGAPLDDPQGKVRFYAGFQFDVTEPVRLCDEMVLLKEDLKRQVEEKTEELREANRSLLVDLADRMRAEVALRDGEAQLRAVFENAHDAMVVLDDERKIVDANESAVQLFEYSLAEMRKLHWDALVPPERLPGIEERWKSFLQGGVKKGEIDVRRAGGHLRLVSFSSRAHICPGRHLVTLRDVTDHREAEDSLRSLSQRLMCLQDEERRRIARELHDSTGQCLAALGMHLDAILVSGPALPERARKCASEALEICKSCAADIRTTSYLLHPPLLDEVGLLPALEWYVSGFSERSGIKVSTGIKEPCRSLTKELKTALFRIIQEALANIHKHAGSKEATINLHSHEQRMVLEISDSGIGIDPLRLKNGRNGAKGLGVGITGMRERVRQLGGTLEIEPAKPGTVIRATFPIMEENNHGNSQSAGC
jgi:PAS domain S-box-containing protein